MLLTILIEIIQNSMDAVVHTVVIVDMLTRLYTGYDAGMWFQVLVTFVYYFLLLFTTFNLLIPTLNLLIPTLNLLILTFNLLISTFNLL